jgi:RNA polymerase sigma-70 factor (ECF subfamily)
MRTLVSNSIEHNEVKGAEVSDAELVAAFCATKDSDAFDTLMLRYQDMVYRVCYRMLGDEESALDVAQEVFLTCYRKLHTFAGKSRFSTWLYRMSVNHCKNFWRRENRAPTQKAISIDQPTSEEDERPIVQLESSNPGPRVDAERSQLRSVIRNRVKMLKPEHQEVLILRYAEELKYDEMAKILECTVGTIKSRLHRARQELRPLIEDVWEGTR